MELLILLKSISVLNTRYILHMKISSLITVSSTQPVTPAINVLWGRCLKSDKIKRRHQYYLGLGGETFLLESLHYLLEALSWKLSVYQARRENTF